MHETGIVHAGDSLKYEPQDGEPGVTVEEFLSRSPDWPLMFPGVGEQAAWGPLPVKIRHGKFSDCRSLGASIEVVIRSGSVGQEMFNEAYSWGLLTRVRRRKGRLALLR